MVVGLRVGQGKSCAGQVDGGARDKSTTNLPTQMQRNKLRAGPQLRERSTASVRSQIPSLPDARPRSDRFRCAGRASKFLAAKEGAVEAEVAGFGGVDEAGGVVGAHLENDAPDLPIALAKWDDYVKWVLDRVERTGGT